MYWNYVAAFFYSVSFCVLLRVPPKQVLTLSFSLLFLSLYPSPPLPSLRYSYTPPRL